MKIHIVVRRSWQANDEVERYRELLKRIKSELDELLGSENVTVSSFSSLNFYRDKILDEAPADAAILVVGGDGTMLTLLKIVARDVNRSSDSRVIGLNGGNLGFIADLPSHASGREIIEHVTALADIPDKRMMLSVAATNSTKPSSLALNDVVIKSTRGSMLSLLITVTKPNNPNSVSTGEFSFRGDGVIITTPTGSTAYNLAAGGPIIEPNLNVIGITPLNPQNLTTRPLIIDDTSVIVIKVTAKDPCGVFVDGQLYESRASLSCQVQRASLETKLAHVTTGPMKYEFYKTLKQKLGWMS